MFKALNPYMLIAMDTTEMPISDIWPGGTPEETEVACGDMQENGTPSRRTGWLDVAGLRYYNAKVGTRKLGNCSLAEILCAFAKALNEEVSRWKDPIPPRPWDPLDKTGIRQWFSPYLRVATVADLREALAEDIGMLEAIESREPTR